MKLRNDYENVVEEISSIDNYDEDKIVSILAETDINGLENYLVDKTKSIINFTPREGTSIEKGLLKYIRSNKSLIENFQREDEVSDEKDEFGNYKSAGVRK